MAQDWSGIKKYIGERRAAGKTPYFSDRPIDEMSYQIPGDQVVPGQSPVYTIPSESPPSQGQVDLSAKDFSRWPDFEKVVFKNIGGNPFTRNPAEESEQWIKENEDSLFTDVFGKMAHRVVDLSPQDSKKWNEIKNKYRQDAENRIKLEIAAQEKAYNWMKGEFDREAQLAKEKKKDEVALNKEYLNLNKDLADLSGIGQTPESARAAKQIIVRMKEIEGLLGGRLPSEGIEGDKIPRPGTTPETTEESFNRAKKNLPVNVGLMSDAPPLPPQQAPVGGLGSAETQRQPIAQPQTQQTAKPNEAQIISAAKRAISQNNKKDAIKLIADAGYNKDEAASIMIKAMGSSSVHDGPSSVNMGVSGGGLLSQAEESKPTKQMPRTRLGRGGSAPDIEHPILSEIGRTTGLIAKGATAPLREPFRKAFEAIGKRDLAYAQQGIESAKPIFEAISNYFFPQPGMKQKMQAQLNGLATKMLQGSPTEKEAAKQELLNIYRTVADTIGDIAGVFAEDITSRATGIPTAQPPYYSPTGPSGLHRGMQ